jgi:hypothetical protein
VERADAGAREQQTDRGKKGKKCWLGLGLGKEFLKKTVHGHTRQSTVHVWCTPDSTQ